MNFQIHRVFFTFYGLPLFTFSGCILTSLGQNIINCFSRLIIYWGTILFLWWTEIELLIEYELYIETYMNKRNVSLKLPIKSTQGTRIGTLVFQLEDTVLLFGTLLLFDPIHFPKSKTCLIIGSVCQIGALLGTSLYV